ncbi:hypothetical protein CEQ90_17495 [Lewinellaceae bacterium SD302]|nr:hypothetical protein CEQ90_17495 [Lewinellaceae bacterium SD302]
MCRSFIKNVIRLFFLFTIFFSSIASLSSQSVRQLGKVTYAGFIDENIFEDRLVQLRKNKPSTYDIVSGDARAGLERSKKIKIELIFDQSSSYSRIVPDLSLMDGSPAAKHAMGMLKLNQGAYALQLAEKKRLRETFLLGDEANVVHVVEDYNKYDWCIEEESKVIGTYNCIKATGSLWVGTQCCGPQKRDLIAWFTLDVPLPYGPGGYDGLPGLILQLTVDHKIPVTFTAQEIILDKSTDKVPSLKKAQAIMTQEEVDIYYENLMTRKKRN